MSFLEQLKQQADQVRSTRGVDSAVLNARIDATELACQTVFKYWIDLAKHLSVIQPPSLGRYVFDPQLVLEGLQFSNFRTDIRARSLGGRTVTDHVALYCDLKTGRHAQLTKNFVADIERLEARIEQTGVRCIPDIRRDRSTNKIVEIHYDFVADMHASVRMRPDHEHGRVEFTMDNLDGIARWVVAFDAAAVDAHLLDELSRWIMGQPHQFRDKGQVLLAREW